MPETDERVAILEEKLRLLEEKLGKYEQSAVQWARGPGRKMLRMLGIELP